MYAIVRGKEELILGRDPGDCLSQFARKFPDMTVADFKRLGYEFVPALVIKGLNVISPGIYHVSIEEGNDNAETPQAS